MKHTCIHCCTERDARLMFQDHSGSWLCRDVVACLEAYANLPGWLRV